MASFKVSEMIMLAWRDGSAASAGPQQMTFMTRKVLSMNILWPDDQDVYIPLQESIEEPVP